MVGKGRCSPGPPCAQPSKPGQSLVRELGSGGGTVGRPGSADRLAGEPAVLASSLPVLRGDLRGKWAVSQHDWFLPIKQVL